MYHSLTMFHFHHFPSTIGTCKDIGLSKCTSVQTSNTTKVCVQNVLCVLECKLEDVYATAWSFHRQTPGGNVSTLRSGVTSAGQQHDSGCDTHAPAASPKSESTGFRSGLFAPYYFSYLSTLFKTWSPTENTMFILFTLTVDCINITSLLDKWLK